MNNVTEFHLKSIMIYNDMALSNIIEYKDKINELLISRERKTN